MSGCGESTSTLDSRKTDSSNTQNEWHEFETPDGKLKLQFPTKPKLIKKTAPSPIGELEITMGVCEVNKKLAYLAMSMAFPVDPSEFDVQAGLQGGVANLKGEVIESKDITKNGLPGNEALVKTPEGMFIRAKTFIDGTGPTMFQLNITAANQADAESAKAERFFDSIEFTQ